MTDDTKALQKAIDANRGGEPGSEQAKAAAVVYLGSVDVQYWHLG